MSACPSLWIRWEKIKEIKLNILAYTYLEFVVLSPSLYMLIQLLSSFSVNSDFYNIHLHAYYVGEYSATIHLDFKE